MLQITMGAVEVTILEAGTSNHFSKSLNACSRSPVSGVTKRVGTLCCAITIAAVAVFPEETDIWKTPRGSVFAISKAACW